MPQMAQTKTEDIRKPYAIIKHYDQYLPRRVRTTRQNVSPALQAILGGL